MTPPAAPGALRAWRHAGKRLRRLEAIASELDLPVPFDVAELAARIADGRGRPIELMPTTWQPGLPCGFLVMADQADYIVYVADTAHIHREHILVHELAHLVCEHHGTGPGQFMPHLPNELVGRVLGRTVYSEPQEEEAELLASLVLQRARRSRPGAGRPEPFFGPAPRTGL